MHAQSQWLGAEQAVQDSGISHGHACTVDNAENVLLGGYYHAPHLIFGSDTLPGAGPDNIYITKYDQTGNVLWTFAGESQRHNELLGLSTDGQDNIVACGAFADTLKLGTITLISDSGQSAGFLVKLDPAGTVLWAVSLNDFDDAAFCHSVTADKDRNIFVTGGYQGAQLILHGFPSGGDTLPGFAGVHYFLAKYDPAGALLWAKGQVINPTSGTCGYSVTIDDHNNPTACGLYLGNNISFGNLNVPDASSAGTNLFVIHYDANGNEQWALGAGDANTSETATAIATGLHNSYYVGGHFSNSALVLGPDTLSTTSIYNFMLMKLDSSGNILWAKQGDAEFSLGSGVAVDNQNTVYAHGVYCGYAGEYFAFNGDTLHAVTGDVYESFILQLDANGNTMCIDRVPYVALGNHSIAVTANHTAVVAGSTTDSCFVGPDTLHNNSAVLSYAVLGKWRCSNLVNVHDAPQGTSVPLASCYPNPASSEVRLLFTAQNGTTEIVLFDALGQQVLSGEQRTTGREEYEITYDVSALPAGVYFFRISSGEEISVCRFVKN
jgi:hypothetical protein